MHGFSTKAIHAGQEPDPTTGAVIPPIHPSSTYAQDGVGGTRPAATSTRAAPTPPAPRCRSASPRWRAGGTAVAFGSGMGATDVLLRVLLRPGDHLVIPHDAYGGTFRLVDKVLGAVGHRAHARSTSPTSTRCGRRCGPTTRVIWCETPTNPLLGIADIAAVADVAREAGARLVVDNTFASPYLQPPLALGADVVLHSTTKYIGGHSDVVGGALITSDDELAEQLRVHPERGGLGARAVRRVAHAARRQDARRAHGAAQRQRRAGRRRCCRAPRGRAGASTRACPSTRATRSRPSRCAGSAGWCRSGWPAAARRRCGCARPPRCSRSPSRSAASSR